MSQRKVFTCACLGALLLIAGLSTAATPDDTRRGIRQIVSAENNDLQIIRGAVSAKEAARRSDPDKLQTVRKRKGLDTKEQDELEFSGAIQATHTPPLMGKISVDLPRQKNLIIGPPVTAPTPSQVLTTVENVTAVPPDTHGAVGRTQIVTALNSGMWINDRSGAEPQRFIDWVPFWSRVLPANLPSHAIFDPRLLYDAANSRYILTLAYFGCDSSSCYREGSLLIAASASDDANGTWQLLRIPLHDVEHFWVDYPNTGQNRNQVVISINSVPNGPNNPEFPSRTQVVMVDKVGLYGREGNLNLAVFNVDPTLVSGSVFYPATDSDSNSSLPLMTLAQSYSGDTYTFHRIHRIAREDVRNGTAVLDLALSSFVSPLPSAHPLPLGNTGLGSAAVLFCSTAPSLVERNGYSWLTAPAAFARNDHTVSGLQWAQVVPESGAVLQNGSVSGAAQDQAFMCGSIAVNSVGDALIGVSQASPQTYLSTGYFFRKSSDAAGSLRSLRQYAAGQSPRFSNVGNNYVRLGDYSHTMLDPLSDRDFWTVQERANTGNGAAITWAQVKLSGIDLEAHFNSGCSQGNVCPVTIGNIGDAAAPRNTSVRFELSASAIVEDQPYAIELSPPTGWRCRSVLGSDLICYKNEAFAAGESSVFSYAYHGTATTALRVTTETREADIQPGNNSVERTLYATQ